MNIHFSGTGITKHFSRSNFTLDVPEVQLKTQAITGVVGENGNGKTTLLNIIAGNLAPTKGNFQYFGETPNTIKDWNAIKDQIAFIPQRIPKWHGTLIQNLTLKAALEKIPSDRITVELDSILAFLGLTKYKHLKWSEISTGYRLRFELARILIGNPKILVLDEPIANLDINAQQQFLADLKHLATKRNTSVILSSQQLHEIETVADQMIFIKGGKAMFSGAMSNLEDNQNTVELLVANTIPLIAFLKANNYSFTQRGVYYQIALEQTTTNTFLTALLAENISITYFRDISKSTKKLF